MKRPPMALLDEADFDAEQTALVEGYRVDGAVVNVVRFLVRFKSFFASYRALGRYSMAGTSLAPRIRELAILRVAMVTGCDYEWGHHVRIGRSIGLEDEEIGRVRQGADHPEWSDPDVLILRAVDALLGTSRLPEELYERLLAVLGQTGLFELLVVVGNYQMLAILLNVGGVPREPGVPALADPLPRRPGSE